MSAPREIDGVAARQRPRLPRQRKRFHLDMRVTVYEQLVGMAEKDAQGRPEALAAVVERLIKEAASGMPAPRK